MHLQTYKLLNKWVVRIKFSGQLPTVVIAEAKTRKDAIREGLHLALLTISQED